uniref:Uncharacterized conserved protein, contains HEPN domain n=1 Tax=Candidatus Kentrum sp. UNK TaxID=2126344 RepID=A0A451ABU8_9GAMM|nr:MAG: Uncharacterized conserved protein, contains HEPN domain [Candidatus Kentron sp. UNK]VFK70848.1 MAG: Uncharacterized conserved protein, contains HEPN domain [Candidatus Kentron sp. UNK]
MRHDADICIQDAIHACELILEFTAGYSLQQYQADPRTKAAVEREFEIIGEALNRVSKIDSRKLEPITDWQQIIQFRNVIAHGYDIVEDRLVLESIREDLPTLLSELRTLIDRNG